MEQDFDRRRAFLKLTERERDERLYDMYTNFVRAIDLQALIQMRTEIDQIKFIMDGISHRKDDTLSTNDKIKAALDNRAKAWEWYRDGILRQSLAQVHTIIILAVLYFVFGGKLP